MSADSATKTLVPALVIAAFLGGLVIGARWHARIAAWIPAAADETPRRGSAPDAPPLWACEMHPDIVRDGPGTCPLCRMELMPANATFLPAAEDEAGGAALDCASQCRRCR